MEFKICHSMAGRIRLSTALLAHPSALAEATLAWLRRQSCIKSARVNYGCASLVLEYVPARQADLEAMLDLIRHLSVDDLEAFLASAAKTPEEPPAPQPKAGSPPQPLTLPTLSLGLALIPHPLAFAVNVPLILYNALPIFKRAWHVWSTEKRLNVDFLDTLAISASLVKGNPMAGSIIVWLVRLGDWIRDLTAAGSKRAVRELLEFRGKSAWVMRDGVVASIPAEDLQVDDHVVVYPGEMIPVDGEILRGHATIDQKTITGEGLAVSRTVGDQIFAACIVQEGQITIRAKRVGDDTTAG